MGHLRHVFNFWRWVLQFGAVMGVLCLGGAVVAAGDEDVLRQLQQLRDQNQRLLNQLGEQKSLIDDLSRKVSLLEQSKSPTPPAEGSSMEPGAGNQTQNWLKTLGRARLTGEGAVGLFHTGSEGKFPNSEFRVDEAKLFLEAPVWDNTYFASEINIVTRDEPTLDVNLRLGELFLEFEDVSRLWGRDGQLAVRAGRFNIPFGEEYQVRNAIQNPLVSHSLSDLWGVDEGVEFYGKLGGLKYVLAVQNGGHPAWRDYDGDKSITARLSYDPKPWLHLSVSGMRTGNLNVENDRMSEMWFGGGFLRALGSATNTTVFHSELFEGDLQIRLPRGHIKSAGGWIHSSDNSPTAATSRDVYYHYTEFEHRFSQKLYSAARFSQILAPDGFPLVGNGDFREYFYQTLTTELWRLSLGLGYRFGPGLVLKGEYSFEGGRTTGGGSRSHGNLFALQAAFQF